MNRNEAEAMLDQMQWRFAKSMPHIPHYYTRRSDCSDVKKFEQLVVFLRSQAVEEKFFSKTFLYFYYGNHKYWTMGSPPEKTQVINRAELSANGGN